MSRVSSPKMKGVNYNMKTPIKQFISCIIDKKYKQANDQLKVVIDQKIKQQIINNNRNIF